MSPSQKVTSAPGLLKAARQVTENDVSYINVTVSLKTKQKMSTSAGKYGQKHVMTGESSNSRRRGRMKALSSTLQDQYKAADHQNSSDEARGLRLSSAAQHDIVPFDISRFLK